MAQISNEADFIYNRELVMTYTVDDLNIVDCNYTLIDNNDDGRYDVILADKYTSFVADYRQRENQTIVGTDRVVYDLKEYFKNGGKMYDDQGREYGLNLMHQYCTVSYLLSKSGRMTHFVVMDDKYQGKLTSTRDNMQYVSIEGTEFKTAAQYYMNLADYDQVKIGDTVMGLVDANGKIMDILYMESLTKPAYLLAAATGMLNTPVVHLGGFSYCIFPWLGTKAFRCYRRMLAKLASRFAISEIEYEGSSYISFRMEKGTPDSLLSALYELSGNIKNPISLVGSGECPVYEKFDDLIPAELLRTSYAADKLDLTYTVRRIGEQYSAINKKTEE